MVKKIFTLSFKMLETITSFFRSEPIFRRPLAPGGGFGDGPAGNRHPKDQRR
jgi:hypothetical protein